MAHDINYSNFLTGITSALSKKHIKKDEARRYKLEHEHYVKLNRLARSQGGTVTLDIDENYYIASLSYSGKE